MTKFLSQGDESFWYYVEMGWAFRPSYDNTIITCQVLDMPDGYYLGNTLDDGIAALGEHTFSQITNLGKPYIDVLRDVLAQVIVRDLYEVKYLFNITKSLAQTLSKLGEVMTFGIKQGDNQILYHCMNIREETLDILRQQNETVFMVDPMKYYTIYDKTMTHGLYLNDCMLVLSNKEKTQIGIVIVIDPVKRMAKLMV